MKVTRVSRVNYSGKVYNFHCTPSENYFAGGILVHNCYKNNKNSTPSNMTLETFKIILGKMNLKVLTQIAFGITGVKTNPDLFGIMDWCRQNSVVPNLTLTGSDLDNEMADGLVARAGALAVSAHSWNKDQCYNTVQMLTSRGLKQCNIHVMVSQETLPFVEEVIKDTESDPRLKDLKAVIFLGLKPKGRGTKSHVLTAEQYHGLIKKCLDDGNPIGFDSCSAHRFEEVVRNSEYSEDKKKQLIAMSDSCESGLFSAYINQEGMFFPCSFMEGEGRSPSNNSEAGASEGEEEWETGIDVTQVHSFVGKGEPWWDKSINILEYEDEDSIWYHPRVVAWRKKLLSTEVEGCRRCPKWNV